MSHYILFLTRCTKSTSFKAGRANRNTRQLNFCSLISYIYCVYQTHTVFTYSDMKYKHKYEQAPSVHPNGIACLQTHSWKNTPNIGHLSFTSSVASPCEALWGKLCQKCFKDKSDFSFFFFFGRRSCCYVCFVARQQPSTKHVGHGIEHATAET